jgi:hypothetical protein
MKAARPNHIILAIAISCTLVLGLTVFLHRKHSRSAAARLEFAELKQSNPILAEKINRIRNSLESETVTESFKRMNLIGSYYEPGPRPGGYIIAPELLPIPAERGAEDINLILSNRRARKVFAELRSEAKALAQQRINLALMGAIDTFLSLYNTNLSVAEKVQLGWSDKGGPGLSYNLIPADPTTVTISGVRLQILALVWFSGELGLEGCKDQVRRVAEIAVQERDELYANQAMNNIMKGETIVKASLYNRQILATGLLGAIGDNNLKTIAINKASLKWENMSLVSFDALLTEYDQPVAAGVMKADRSKGSINIRIASPLSDFQFDTLLRELGVISGSANSASKQ